MKAFLVVMLSYLTIWSGVTFATPGYVVDGSGQIVKTGTELCLRNGTWTAADAVRGCDPVAEKRAVPVSLDSDVLFEFDSAVLSQSGKTILDAVAAMANGNVIVEGHTDRIGTAAYNQRLSLARATAVANYLKSRTGTKTNYAVSGVGFSKPSGKTAQCRGPVNQKLIDCLAPDRRVVVTIIK